MKIWNRIDQLPGRLAPILAATLVFCTLSPVASSQVLPLINLGTAADFGVLAGAGITNTGPTQITGDIGSYATVSITGADEMILLGTNHGGDVITQAAKGDLGAAYLDAESRLAPLANTYFTPVDLGGLTLLPGVYKGTSSLGITGGLTLDAGGDPNAIWIFQAASTLVAEVGSSVILTGSAQASNVFWQVGSSATLNAGTDFAGNILALTSISLGNAASIDGRLLAINGEVTLINNAISVPVPEPASMAMLSLGCLMLCRRQRAIKPRAGGQRALVQLQSA